MNCEKCRSEALKVAAGQPGKLIFFLNISNLILELYLNSQFDTIFF
ncbi:hypothetical protein Gotur_004896 [Gossypium turneri]